MLENFGELYNLLEETQEDIAKGTEEGLKTAGVRVMGAAKAKLGTYQPASGPYPGWPKLKAETVRRKHLRKNEVNKAENALYVIEKGKYAGDIRFKRHLTKAGKDYLKKHGGWGGGGNDDAPLVDTGHLKAAITTDNQDIGNGIVYVGVVGPPGKYAKAHECGYAKKGIPPRPYLRPAAYENREEVRQDIAEAIKEGLGSLWKS